MHNDLRGSTCDKPVDPAPGLEASAGVWSYADGSPGKSSIVDARAMDRRASRVGPLTGAADAVLRFWNSVGTCLLLLYDMFCASDDDGRSKHGRRS